MPHLGYPIEGVYPCWVIEVVFGKDAAGRDKVVAVAFLPDQAREIARRMVA